MDTTLIKYKDIKECVLTIYANGGMSFDGYRRPSALKGKSAFLADSMFVYYIQASCLHSGAGITKVHVVPEVKTSRDMIRKSYTIVRDPDKADAVVIPEAFDPRIRHYNIIVHDTDTDTLYAVTIYRRNGWHQENNIDLKDYKDSIISYINASFSGHTLKIAHNEDMEQFRVEFIQPADVYDEILKHTYPFRRYINETQLVLQTPNIISPETLVIWSKMTDNNMFEQAICMSDWKDYPHTLCYLLSLKGHSSFSTRRDFRLVMETICYYDYTHFSEEYDKGIIQPKDWNMFQRFLMLLKHVDQEKGGFTPQGTCIIRDGTTSIDCVRRRVAIAPLFIDAPMSYKNLLQLAKES